MSDFMSPRRPSRSGLGTWLAMGLTLLLSVTLIAYTTVERWPRSLEAAPLGGAALTSGGSVSGAIGTYLAFTTIALVTLAAAGLTPWRAGFGVQLARGARPWARTTRATAVYLAVLLGLGLLSSSVTVWTGTRVASVGEAYAGFDWGRRLASSAWAATWEETANVAVPVGLAFVGVWITRLARGDVQDDADQRVPAWCFAAGIFGLVTRFADHLYQGSVSAWFVVVVGIGALAIFARYGTIVPLVAGHFIFDAFMVGRTFFPAGSVGGLMLNGGVIAVVVGATLVRRPQLRAGGRAS